MDELLAGEDASLKQLTQGEVVEGTVLVIKKHEVLIDLGPHGVGLVPRREIGFSRALEVGDAVTASIVDPELENGQVLLSLRKAAKDKGWDELAAKMESGEIIDVSPYDANRGGLLVEYDGVRGFLPVSQLSAEH
jgi:small subunit ribosomal protein S1